MTNTIVTILGVQVHPLTVAELHAQLADLIEEGKRAQVLNVNVHGLNLAVQNSWLRDALNEAEIVFCDGAGVILGARLLGHHIPERITYADWMWQLAEFAAVRSYSLYFLGAKTGIAQEAANRLIDRFPDLKIVGAHDGYFNKTEGHAENEDVIMDINAKRPNILLVGMGMPLQERWLYDNWSRIDANIALTGGAVFEYLSGNLRRAPTWMTNNGLEWLGRLIIEPSHLWRRYLFGNPRFLFNVLKEKLRSS